jgi:hypothetical protein
VKQPILPSSSSSSSSTTTTTSSSSSNNPNLSGALKFQNYQFSKN